MKICYFLLYILITVSGQAQNVKSLLDKKAAVVKPNILIMYADDLGIGDVQCYNPERGKIPTPNIDRLSAQGMRFTDAHASASVCTPSRYTLLTGEYHWREIQSNLGPWDKPIIQPDQLTIASLAKKHGYRTACFGKWHLGLGWDLGSHKSLFARKDKANAKTTDEHRAAWREVFSKPITGGPTDLGFDEYFGVYAPNWPPFCFIENDHTVGIPSEFLDPEQLTNHLASKQGPALKDWSLDGVLPALEKRSIEFIEGQSKTAEPFFLYLSLTSPHTPHTVSEEWKAKSGLNRYGDFVMQTDAVVGAVLQALKESGAEQNTLVLFASDNGCAPEARIADLETMGHFPSGNLRGAKFVAWEGGHRLPFIVRWPGVVEPNTTCDQLAHQADLMATFSDMFGYTLPPDAGEDSVSLLPLLTGSTEAVREHAISASARGEIALRVGDWKYITWFAKRKARQRGAAAGGELYNLADDPGEKKNLIKQHPERVAEMRALLGKLRNQKAEN